MPWIMVALHRRCHSGCPFGGSIVQNSLWIKHFAPERRRVCWNPRTPPDLAAVTVQFDKAA